MTVYKVRNIKNCQKKSLDQILKIWYTVPLELPWLRRNSATVLWLMEVPILIHVLPKDKLKKLKCNYNIRLQSWPFKGPLYIPSFCNVWICIIINVRPTEQYSSTKKKGNIKDILEVKRTISNENGREIVRLGDRRSEGWVQLERCFSR